MSDLTRVCLGCGLIPPVGPLTYEWDAHRVVNPDPKKGEKADSLVLTCSDDCRDRCGFKRRRPVPRVRKLMTFDI